MRSFTFRILPNSLPPWGSLRAYSISGNSLGLALQDGHTKRGNGKEEGEGGGRKGIAPWLFGWDKRLCIQSDILHCQSLRCSRGRQITILYDYQVTNEMESNRLARPVVDWTPTDFNRTTECLGVLWTSTVSYKEIWICGV